MKWKNQEGKRSKLNFAKANLPKMRKKTEGAVRLKKRAARK